MRLIDADAFKEYIKSGIDGLILPKDQAVKVIAITKSFLKDIDEQPTIVIPVSELDTTEDFGKWILCSDRLPEEHGYYIVQTDGSHNSAIDIAEYGKFFRKPEYKYVLEWNKASKVIAWMPLPEPYKKEGE